MVVEVYTDNTEFSQLISYIRYRIPLPDCRRIYIKPIVITSVQHNYTLPITTTVLRLAVTVHRSFIGGSYSSNTAVVWGLNMCLGRWIVYFRDCCLSRLYVYCFCLLVKLHHSGAEETLILVKHDPSVEILCWVSQDKNKQLV